MLFLSASDCRKILDTEAVLEAVEDALRMEQAGRVRWSTPSGMRVGGGEAASRVRVKACALQDAGFAGVRVLVFPTEKRETRWILIFDDATGEPRAIVDEAWTYSQRSVACLAFVARSLSLSEVQRVGLIGAGRIARSALPYVHRLFPGAALAVSSRREETRRRLAREAREAFEMEAAPYPVEEAVRGSEVVLTCTSAGSAILRDAWVAPGTVVGSLDTAECGPELFARADLRVADGRDQLEAELVEAYGGSAPERIDATMAEVVTGVHPGRTSERQRILILSQGLVSQDVLLAGRAYREASARGIGTELPIEGGSSLE